DLPFGKVITDVGTSSDTDPVVDCALCNGSFKAVRLSHTPVRHEAAVRAAGHPQIIFINPVILIRNVIYSTHNIFVIAVAVVAADSINKLLGVAVRASRINE